MSNLMDVIAIANEREVRIPFSDQDAIDGFVENNMAGVSYFQITWIQPLQF